MEQYLDRKQVDRKTPLSCGNRPSETKRRKAIAKLGDRYDVISYRQAIHRACDRAFPAPEGTKGLDLEQWRSDHRWNPNQLRHSRATIVRDKYSLDHVQSVLGHSHASMAEHYGKLALDKSVEVAAALG
jgi:integrase